LNLLLPPQARHNLVVKYLTQLNAAIDTLDDLTEQAEKVYISRTAMMAWWWQFVGVDSSGDVVFPLINENRAI